jgi:hypothetical protein
MIEADSIKFSIDVSYKLWGIQIMRLPGGLGRGRLDERP